MADAKIVQLTAAAARRRSFAASQKKGDSPGGSAPAVPTGASLGASGPVAGLTAITKPTGIPKASVGPNGGATDPAAAAGPSPYLQHAVALSQVAHTNGAPALASAIRAVAAVPHPVDKQAVAQNYLNSQPPAVAHQHKHMFTKTLMAGGQ